MHRRLMNALVGISALGVALVIAGCSCETRTTVPPPDGGPPVDAPRADAGQRLDSGTTRMIECVTDPVDDVFLIGRDDETDPPAVISIASTADAFTVVWAENSDRTDNMRRIMYARFDVDGDVVAPTSIGDAAIGGSAPHVVARDGGGYLVTWQRGAGPEVVVQPFDATMTPTGAPVVVSTGSATLPRLVAVRDGMLAVWVSGNQVMGRTLNASGNPSGAASVLADTGTPPARVRVSQVGATGELLVAWSPAAGAATPVRVRALDPTGATAGMARDLGVEPTAGGAIDVAGISRASDPMLAPFEGASVFDALVAGDFREVRFRIVDREGNGIFAEAAITEPGRSSWDPSITEFLDGYMIAHRAMVPDPMGGTSRFPVLRLAFLDRNGCRLGRAAHQYNVAGLNSLEGGAIAIEQIGGTRLLVGWSEILFDASARPDVTDYRVARVTCN